MKLLLYEDYNDLTSPNSNQIPHIDIAVSVVYNTFKKFFFEHSCSYGLILHSNSMMELGPGCIIPLIINTTAYNVAFKLGV